MSKSDNVSKENKNSRIGVRSHVKYDASTIGLNEGNHGTGESFDNSLQGGISISLKNRDIKGDEHHSTNNKIQERSMGLGTDIVQSELRVTDLGEKSPSGDVNIIVNFDEIKQQQLLDQINQK